jgi:hypothetical protein
MHHRLRRGRAGHEIRRADHVEETLLRHPPPPLDDLGPEHGDVRRRPAERRPAETEHQRRHLAQRARLLRRDGSIRRRLIRGLYRGQCIPLRDSRDAFSICAIAPHM